ncbi:MAG: DNA gyrase inhibitor YacG [Myxococcota bacterium]|nr:DNA gyrase inhibitor YacG [Myxococcota bacterium]
MLTCAICSKSYAQDGKHSPFCSKRCQDVDLGRWFGGSYRIASDEPPDEVELEIARRKALDE